MPTVDDTTLYTLKFLKKEKLMGMCSFHKENNWETWIHHVFLRKLKINPLVRGD